MLRRLLGADISYATQLESRFARVRADLGQIQRAPINVSSNAREATPRDGGR
jgi:hypothetical protein